MREQVELLEHHPDLAPHVVDLLEVGAELHPVDDDAAALPILEPIDAAKQRRLAAARRAADDDAFPPHHLEVDIPEHVEGAEPLVETGDLDRHRIIARVTVPGSPRGACACRSPI